MAKKYFRTASQLAFLILFALLLYLNKLQLWIAVFIIGAVASVALGSSTAAGYARWTPYQDRSDG